jgi:hypothetical protein
MAATIEHPEARAGSSPALRRVLIALAVWAFGYACYRAYYGFGGQAAMIGRPVSMARFRHVNLVGAAIVMLAALVPLIVPRHGLGSDGRARRWLLALCWLAAVGCCMHALVDGTLRILSLAGVHRVSYPSGFWVTVDRRTADLQDLFFNEPWFFLEGCLWALLAVLAVGTQEARRRWLRSAVAGCLLATAVGLLTGLGVIASVRLG